MRDLNAIINYICTELIDAKVDYEFSNIHDTEYVWIEDAPELAEAIVKHIDNPAVYIRNDMIEIRAQDLE